MTTNYSSRIDGQKNMWGRFLKLSDVVKKVISPVEFLNGERGVGQ